MIIIALSLVYCCNEPNSKKIYYNEHKKNLEILSENIMNLNSPLNIINKNDTLKIVVEKSSCGEWGGNKEYMFLQRNENNEICLRLIIDTISCDQIFSKNGCSVLDDRYRIVILDTTKILKVEEELLISQMLQRLLELYLKDEVYSNAGDYYEIINTDGTLSFCYWNSGNYEVTKYYQTRKLIFGDY